MSRPRRGYQAQLISSDLGLVGVTDDLTSLEARMSTLSLERTFRIIQQLYEIHADDHNFPRSALDLMATFLTAAQEITDNPEKHLEIIHEMKMEALLSTENSPYLEVRANVEPTDDFDMPVLTFRVLVIGTVFSAVGRECSQPRPVNASNPVHTLRVKSFLC